MGMIWVWRRARLATTTSGLLGDAFDTVSGKGPLLDVHGLEQIIMAALRRSKGVAITLTLPPPQSLALGETGSCFTHE